MKRSRIGRQSLLAAFFVWSSQQLAGSRLKCNGGMATPIEAVLMVV